MENRTDSGETNHRQIHDQLATAQPTAYSYLSESMARGNVPLTIMKNLLDAGKPIAFAKMCYAAALHLYIQPN